MEPRTFSTDPLFNSLAVVSVLLAILLVRKYIDILPAVFRSLFKWKESLRLEYSVRLGRDRNMVYAALIIPACLMLDRYSVGFPSFMSGIHPALHLAGTFLIFFVYLSLRALMKAVCRRRMTDALAYKAVYCLFRSFFCIAVPLCLATVGILTVAKVSAYVVRTAIFDEIVISYALLLLRQREILSHYCTVLTTILYLCALELLPAGFLVILWIV